MWQEDSRTKEVLYNQGGSQMRKSIMLGRVAMVWGIGLAGFNLAECKVITSRPSFTDNFHKQIIDDVTSKSAKEKIGILFGAYYRACSMSLTSDPQTVEDVILREAIRDSKIEH